MRYGGPRWRGGLCTACATLSQPPPSPSRTPSGYGLAMVLQAAVIARTSLGLASLTKTSLAALPPPALAALALHAAHGAWLALFLAARDGLLRTYAPKKAAIDARAAKLGPGARAGMWVGVAGLYVCLAVPAWAVATAGRGVLASCPRAATITSAGLSLAAFGLWLEGKREERESFPSHNAPGRARCSTPPQPPPFFFFIRIQSRPTS